VNDFEKGVQRFPPPIDTLIAGTAVAHSATLVTHNTKEFSRVRGLRLLDWY
jgi:tRNA(fMet)-specific endonuclease VapC